METLMTIIGWATALFLGLVTVLLLMRKESGLKLIQQRSEMLPQAMLVRYLAAALLALVAAMLGAPRVLFAMMLMIAVVGFGDAYIYRRQGHPFWMHVGLGIGATIGALIALFNFGGAA